MSSIVSAPAPNFRGWLNQSDPTLFLVNLNSYASTSSLSFVLPNRASHTTQLHWPIYRALTHKFRIGSIRAGRFLPNPQYINAASPPFTYHISKGSPCTSHLFSLQNNIHDVTRFSRAAIAAGTLFRSPDNAQGQPHFQIQKYGP